MQHSDVALTPAPDSDPRNTVAVLQRELDTLLSNLRQALALQPRIAELERIRHEEFDRGGGWTGRSPEEVAAFYANTGPQQQEILDLQEQHRRVVDRSREFGGRVRQYVVDLACEIAAAEPLLDPTDELVRQFANGSVAPDAFLLGLRGILRRARQATGVLSIPEEAAHDQPEATASAGMREEAAIASRKRERGPDLETSRKRIELWDKLASELATIFKQVRHHATVPMLKARYPGFEIWERLSESEQAELPAGRFKPRAYAGHLVLRAYGLTSLEALRKDRQKLRKAGE
jgi:hypothetical protein